MGRKGMLFDLQKSVVSGNKEEDEFSYGTHLNRNIAQFSLPSDFSHLWQVFQEEIFLFEEHIALVDAQLGPVHRDDCQMGLTASQFIEGVNENNAGVATMCHIGAARL